MTGLNARLYASQYPEDVVGMVLVDVTHPDQADRFRAALPEESPSESVAPKLFRQDTAFTVRGTEQVDLGASCAQVRVTGSLGNIPLVVLTRSLPAFDQKGLDPDLVITIELEWVRMQQDLAKLSSHGIHMAVPDSSHMIQLDQPQAVADAILSVLAQVRGE
ncbi:MAG: alpha/beta hydrolase [Anaerolineae bacterium]|nr:alpha/beta hydrolase [Anaerolineae bacterium]